MSPSDPFPHLPILNVRLLNAIVKHIVFVQQFIEEDACKFAERERGLADSISCSHQRISDFLIDQKYPITDLEADRLADFLSLFYRSFAVAITRHDGEDDGVMEPILDSSFFCPLHNAIMNRHLQHFLNLSQNAWLMYDHDEADEQQAIYFIVDNFIAHLKARGERLYPNFQRALTEYVLLSFHIFLSRIFCAL
ncbi:MAG: hypothetical protein Q4E43_04950 [Akkermansia sp.]|nr:hypothetical protein [Akkermansia sp.]